MAGTATTARPRGAEGRRLVLDHARPADAIPVEITAANLVMPDYPLRAGHETEIPAADPARSRYADLIDPEALDKEQRCLSEAVYFEARSESETGQAAVAQVVLNRVKSGLYPQSICGVVYQNRHRYMGCQFSFACEGKSLRVGDGPPGPTPPASPARCWKAGPTWPKSAARPTITRIT